MLTARVRASVVAVLALLCVVAGVLVPAEPASANAPVAAFPYLPSTFVAGTSSAPVMPPPGATEEEMAEWRLRDRNYRFQMIAEARSQNYTPRTAPQPVSPPKLPTRGIGGGPLGMIMLAPVVVNGALQVLAISREGQALGLAGEADEIVCQGIGPTSDNWFLSMLYGDIDCGMIVVDPNPGEVASIAFPSGRRLAVVNMSSAGNEYSLACVQGPSLYGTGTTIHATITGSPTASEFSSNVRFNSSWCSSSMGVSHAAEMTNCVRNAPTNGCTTGAGGLSIVSAYLRRDSTGEVLETAAVSSADPDRQARCRVGWGDGTITTGAGITYREDADGFPITSSAMGCEEAYAQRPSPGVMPEWVKIESDKGGSITEIADLPIPAEVEQPKPSEGLRLFKVVGTLEKSCNNWEADCGEWWEESDRGQQTDKYRCRFGDNDVALTECGIYRYTFREPQDIRITDPGEDPNASPTPGNQAQWGSGTNPYTPPAPGSTVTGGGACTPTFSFNPVDWVVNPIKCLTIPARSKVDETTARIHNAWGQSTPGRLAAVIGTVPPALDGLGAGNCGGIILPVPKVGAGWSVSIENRAMLAACPGDFFAPWAPLFYWLITGGICVAGFFIIKRFLDRFVGFGGAS